MSTPFPGNVPYIVDGQPVSAATVNNPLYALDRRTVSLNEKITNALIGPATVIYEAPVLGNDVTPGMVVYRDEDGVFKPAAAVLTEANGLYSIGKQGFAWGICQFKYSPNLANIVLNGTLSLKESELEAVTVAGNADTGLLFVSAVLGTAGKLTPTKPPIGITACYVAGPDGFRDGEPTYTMYVNVGWNNPFEDHIHFSARLGVDVSNWKTVLAQDGAPAGAQYLYVFDEDAALAAVWPPVPISAVHYDIDGVAADLITNDQIAINEYGIWWMDAVNDPFGYRHDFYFTRMTFKTDASLVQSLVSATPALTVTDSNGDPASTGNLTLDLDFSFDTDESTVTGVAVKEVDGLQLKLGPVVDGIRSATPSLLTISGGTALDAPNDEFQAGLLSLTVLPSENRDNPVTFVELEKVQIKTASGIKFYAMPNGLASSLLGRVEIPEVGFTVGQDLDLYITVSVWARAAGTMADITTTRAVVPRPAALDTPQALTPSFSSGPDLELSNAGAVVANNYWRAQVLVATAVHPGDIVFFTLNRAASDGYAGDVGVISLKWRIEPTP